MRKKINLKTHVNEQLRYQTKSICCTVSYGFCQLSG
jgi:hypothetical protein